MPHSVLEAELEDPNKTPKKARRISQDGAGTVRREEGVVERAGAVNEVGKTGRENLDDRVAGVKSCLWVYERIRRLAERRLAGAGVGSIAVFE